MSAIRKMGRREFLARTGAAAAGLVLSVPLRQALAAAPARLEPNAFLSVGEGGDVDVWVARSEMGQGVRTALPMIVADELGVDLGRVRVREALADPRYGQMMTVGSTSVRNGWEPLR
ncbi:MAG TPA: molybdopterin cofactor-binding domain-containing protein, partial [Anaeromyxobacter sp.]|nr:molybdopterin cofactor-binding domain-containing protein [Anaeromyxobacter sp.]